MKMELDNRFLTREYLKNLFPMIFSVLGGTINTLIDSVFISARLGETALAAVNMSMPVYLVVCTLGTLIVGGASVLSSREAGAQRMDKAVEYCRTAFTVCALFGSLLMAAGALLCHPVTDMLSQGSGLEEYIYGYCFVTMFSIPSLILSYLPIYYLQLDGKSHEITVMMRIMIITDVVLDYVLLYLIPLGVYGAALASLLSTLASCIYGFYALARGFSNYHVRPVKFGMSQVGEIVRNGSPSALGNFADAVKLLLLNSIVLYAGGTSAAAVWAVLNTMSELAVAITSGVPAAAAPMMGAYVSSRENGGLRILVRLQMRWGLLLTAVYAVLLVVGSGVLRKVFSINQSLFMPLSCLGVYVVIDGVIGIWTVFFQAAGRLLLSNLLMLGRKLLFPVAAAWALMLTGGYLWLFAPVAAVCTILMGLAATQMVYSKNKTGDHALSRILLLDDYLEREKKVLDFSIVPTVENICSASGQIVDFCTINHLDPRQTMRLQLSIEELLTVIVQKITDLEAVDLRAFALEENTGIRIRYAGKLYNPFAHSADEDEDMMMGVSMLEKMAEDTNYIYSFGMNIINVVV